MKMEFENSGPNSAKSSAGFTVTWRPSGGVDYSDENGTIRIDSETLVKPASILVYSRSGGLKKMSEGCAEEIIKNIIKALEYLGHKVERW